MSFISDRQHSYTHGLLLGILVGGVSAYAVAYYLNSKSLRARSWEGPGRSQDNDGEKGPPMVLQRAMDDEILAEQFTRNVQFFGADGQQGIFDAFVVVVGLGVHSQLCLEPQLSLVSTVP